MPFLKFLACALGGWRRVITPLASLVGNAMVMWPFMRAKLAAMHKFYIGMIHNISRFELLRDLVIIRSVSSPSSSCYDCAAKAISSFVKSQSCVHICFNVLLIIVLMKAGFFQSLVEKKRDDHETASPDDAGYNKQAKRICRRRSHSFESLDQGLAASSSSPSSRVINRIITRPLSKDISHGDNYEPWRGHVNSLIRVNAHTELAEEAADKLCEGDHDSEDEFHGRVEDFILKFRRRIWVESNLDRNLMSYGPFPKYHTQDKILPFQPARASVS